MPRVTYAAEFPRGMKVLGKLDPGRARPEELRGQEVFFGKGQCSACLYYNDNLMHNLHVEPFYKPQFINSLIAPSGNAR